MKTPENRAGPHRTIVEVSDAEPGKERKTYFVADVHLGDSRYRGEQYFCSFLESLVGEAQVRRPARLVILGDLFDYWYENGPQYPPRRYDRALERLREAADSGVEVLVLTGNRDFMLGKAFERISGARVVGERVALKLGPYRVLSLHGDQLCTRDLRYRLWRMLVRSRTALELTHLVPVKQADIVAMWLSHFSGMQRKRRKSKKMALSYRAIMEELDRGFDILICGHVHSSTRRAVPASSTSRNTGRNYRELIVLGSWRYGPSILTWDGETLHFE